MSYVSLYDSNNTKYNFIIGNCTPGGSYTGRNAWSCTGTMISGTVNGVTVPAISRYDNWKPWSANPPVYGLGSNLNSLGDVIGASSTKNFYTKPDSQGSYFTISTDANKRLRQITVHSGSYSVNYESFGGDTIAVSFVWVNGAGNSQYDNLSLFFEVDNFFGDNPRGLHFGGISSLNAVFTNSTSSDIQARFDSGSLINASGNEGFKPIGDIARYTIGGGDISGELPGYTTDELELPGAPDESVASAVKSGMINVYQITDTNLAALGRALFGTEGINGLITKLENSFLNPLDAIISLQVFPCTPDVGSSEYIKLFDWSAYVDKLGTTTSGNRLTNQFKTYNFGSLSVAEMWQSYLDYDSTAFELYLPFIGSVDIPISEVVNGSVEVEYTVDFLTGMCVANVLCTKNVPLSSGRSVPQYTEHSFMGNCSVQIPLNNVSYGNIIGSVMQAASSGLRTGNAGVAVASLVESGLSGGLQPSVKTKGTVVANAGFCSCLYPYISVTRPITAEPSSFQEVNGYPSYIEGSLSMYKGLCVCDNIILSNLAGATDSEINRIKQICSEGIYV